MVVEYAASAPSVAGTVAPDVGVPGESSSPRTSQATYRQFYEAVTRTQLMAWLPRRHRFLVDISGPRARSAEIAASAGHTVLRVADEQVPPRPPTQERLRTLIADTSSLAFLADDCADGVIAGDRALSTHLGAESMIAGIARVLRPGGRVLASVDSLVLGMAMLADQHRWAHLVDLPNAEVVLVPWPDGSITRCYGHDQLRELVTGAGLTVGWMRPLTVLSESMVNRTLGQDPDSMPRLVRAELGAGVEYALPDESFGAQLVVSAYKS